MERPFVDENTLFLYRIYIKYTGFYAFFKTCYLKNINGDPLFFSINMNYS